MAEIPSFQSRVEKTGYGYRLELGPRTLVYKISDEPENQLHILRALGGVDPSLSLAGVVDKNLQGEYGLADEIFVKEDKKWRVVFGNHKPPRKRSVLYGALEAVLNASQQTVEGTTGE